MRRYVVLRCPRSLPCAVCLLALAGCGAPQSWQRPPGPAEQCPAWGYAPDDPACLRLFRRDPP